VTYDRHRTVTIAVRGGEGMLLKPGRFRGRGSDLADERRRKRIRSSEAAVGSDGGNPNVWFYFRARPEVRSAPGTEFSAARNCC